MRYQGNKAAGVSIIEMLVGISIGLIVVGTAVVMLVTTLKSQKDITASARLNQELDSVMMVMSNEIRRAGFRICDADTYDCPFINDPLLEEEGSFITYEYADVIEVGQNTTNGDCILYRYNADVDQHGNDPADPDYLSEYRGYRLITNADGVGVIQMADDTDAAIACNTNANARWVDLTNPDVIDVTGLSFSTTGSKCRNMTLPEPNPAPEITTQYWVVNEAPGVIQTGLACEDGTNPVDSYIIKEDSVLPYIPTTNETVGTSPVDIDSTVDDVFATHQITITVQAELTRDDTVTKDLQSSVKVANPWVTP